MYKLWISNPDSVLSKVLISGLKLFSTKWERCDDPINASLWCIDASVDDIDSMVEHYSRCSEPKPRVIYLAETFTPMPVSQWVFFKSPINIRVLHKWLLSNKYIPDFAHEQDTTDKPQKNKPKWQLYRFKLCYWPNVTQYTDGADIMMVCSMMMHDWCEYSQLIPFGIDEEILLRMLDDADKEDNLMYQSEPIDASQPDTAVAESEQEPEKGGLGIFKKIFNRFRK